MKPLFTWRSAISESDLTSTEKHVALALSLYMSERGESAFPGPTRLARDTSLDTSTVKEKLRALEKRGWLCCVERGGIKGEKRRANVYAATSPPAELNLVPGAHGTRSAGDPVSSAARPGAHGTPNTPENSPLVGATNRRAQIPDPFTLTDQDLEWAETRTPDVNVTEATEEFVTYWRGRGDTRASWPQTWRNWLLKLSTRRSA